MSSIRFWRTVLLRGSFRVVWRSSPPATGTEPSQRLDISGASRRIKGQRIRGGSAYPIIVKDAVADLHEDVPCRLLECQLHILSGARASLDEQQTFFFRPQLSFFSCHLSISLSRAGVTRAQVGLVANEDARQMRVRVQTDILEPRPGIQETWGPLCQHCIMSRWRGWDDGLTDSAANRRHRRANNQRPHDNMI